jgi:hypothetical protein
VPLVPDRAQIKPGATGVGLEGLGQPEVDRDAVLVAEQHDIVVVDQAPVQAIELRPRQCYEVAQRLAEALELGGRQHLRPGHPVRLEMILVDAALPGGDHLAAERVRRRLAPSDQRREDAVDVGTGHHAGDPRFRE